MTIKIIFTLLLLNFTVQGKDYSSTKQILPSKSHQVTTPKPKVRKITKGKNGEFIISWGVLAEYNLSAKDLTKKLKKVVNKEVSINGYMVPLDYNAKEVSEFLLVPYIPSCFHVPPPPINSIINVKVGGGKKVKSQFIPVRVVGKLTINKAKKGADPNSMEGIYNIISTSVVEE